MRKQQTGEQRASGYEHRRPIPYPILPYLHASALLPIQRRVRVAKNDVEALGHRRVRCGLDTQDGIFGDGRQIQRFEDGGEVS